MLVDVPPSSNACICAPDALFVRKTLCVFYRNNIFEMTERKVILDLPLKFLYT